MSARKRKKQIIVTIVVLLLLIPTIAYATTQYVTVLPAPSVISGQITYTHNNTGIPEVTVNLTNATTMTVIHSTTTNETGYYNLTTDDLGAYYINASKPRFWDNATTISVTANETISVNLTLWLKGDLNNNGIAADADDHTLMTRAVLWEIPGDWRWDLNENGEIADAGDLVLMSRAAVDEIVLTVLPGSGQPSTDSFGVSDVTGEPETHVIVPVTLTNTSNSSIMGIVFNIAYDKEIITVTNVAKGNLTAIWYNGNTNNNFTWGSRVLLSTGQTTQAIPLGLSGSVVLLNFSVAQTSESYSHMTVSDIQLSDPEGKVGTAPARNGLFYVGEIPTPPPDGGGGGGGGSDDSDDDGYSDIDELIAGTDPNDPNSYPGFTEPAIRPPRTPHTTPITTPTTPTPTVTPPPITPTPTPPSIPKAIPWKTLILALLVIGGAIVVAVVIIKV